MVNLSIPIKLLTDPITGRSAQTEFFNLTKRHQCFSGGYGNGKSYAASLKALLLLTTFPKYRVAICRYSTVDLKRSTMSTFFKICPPELYDPKAGGNRADSLNYLRLINGSEVFWMHLDDADENTVRGLEVNSVIIDQAEEISENMYNHLSARVGRWDMAMVPEVLLEKNPNWPRNPETNKPLVPAYCMPLCNPDSELHWLYRRFHPESSEHQESFKQDYEMVQASSSENPTLDKATLRDMMQNDPIWVKRFVLGKWGIPGGSIHEVSEDSILELGRDISDEFLQNCLRSGSLYRVLDHGDASPTCCLWFCSYKDWFFCYREYYRAGALISDHRREIAALSKYPDGSPETYRNNWADPAIFIKAQQKNGGFWTVADEYLDKRIEFPGIAWNKSDNNEMATRNRINEYLRPNIGIRHPTRDIGDAPRLYFIRKAKNSAASTYGCYNAILELKGQKRKQLGTVNGKPIYSDDRSEDVADHAYDPIRYFCAQHPYWSSFTKKTMPQGSFFNAQREYKKLKLAGYFDKRIELGVY